MRNVVVQQSWSEYPDFVQYLTELGFERMVLGTSSARLKGKYALAWQAVRSSFRLVSRLRVLRDAGIVVASGPFAYVIKLLARLRLIRYQNLFCFAFFVHAPSWFPYSAF